MHPEEELKFKIKVQLQYLITPPKKGKVKQEYLSDQVDARGRRMLQHQGGIQSEFQGLRKPKLQSLYSHKQLSQIDMLNKSLFSHSHHWI